MSNTPQDPAALRAEILRLTREYSRLSHGNNRPGYLTGDPLRPTFKAGSSSVPYAGRVFTEDEVEAGVASMLDFWLTLGKEGEAFEQELAAFMGVQSSVLANSGSSANLLAVSALSSYRLGNRRLKAGDEVITVAAGFPTTVAPIFQNGFVPVFIDNDPNTLNGKVEMLEEALVPGKTKAIIMAHTLGNPFNLSVVLDFCKKHGLWLIEDNCDALGCKYDDKYSGTYGDMSTQSFYPPHHLTLGEGGAVNIINQPKLRAIVESFRDWGRDCWCASGKDNTCGKRFDWQAGSLPKGYDHKFIYAHLGYNIKPLDPQAAIGRQQLKKLPQFIQARVDNWNYLRAGLADLEEYFDFMLPTHATGWTKDGGFTWDNSGHRTLCSWFGFMLRVKPSAPFKKFEFARHLDAQKIGNRMLFGGNLLRQPVLTRMREELPGSYRVVGDMTGADQIMNEALFVAVYPGLNTAMMDYMIETIHAFVKKH